MSIFNRHPNIHKIITTKTIPSVPTHPSIPSHPSQPSVPTHPSIPTYPTHTTQPSPHTPNKTWTIIFLKTIFDNLEFDIDKYFYELNAKILQQLTVEKFYIYAHAHPDNINRFGYLLDIGAELIDTATIPKSNSLKLFICDQFMAKQKNIILISNTNGFYYDADLSVLNIFDHIFSDFVPIDQISESIGAYNGIADKFCLDKIATTNVMVVTFDKQNAQLINNSLNMANQLMYTDMDLMTNISLTVNNCRNVSSAKKIKNITTLSIYPFYLDTDHNIHLLVEHFMAKKCSINLHNTISFNDPDYIFYPCVDINYSLYLDGIKLSKADSNTNGCSVTNTNGYSVTNTNECSVTNTNGNSAYILPDQSVYNLMYNRFDDKNCGIFVRCQYTIPIIPKILHHIWLDIVPVTNYTNAWGRILKEPWEYIIWTESKLKLDVLVGEWLEIYNNSNQSIKLLVIYLAIMEKYGGVVIDSFNIPIKIFPDEFLSNNFVTSFIDEKNQGQKLCYRIMASVPGIVGPIKKMHIHPNASRIPFDGLSNLYTGNRSDNLETNKNNVPQFIHMLRQLLISTKCDIDMIQQAIISSPIVTIYPSYYFNPSRTTLTKKLIDCAICINLWKIKTSPVYPKTELKRVHKINDNGILANLSIDPKDKLANTYRI